MSYLKTYEAPSGPAEYLIMALGGWPDAGEGATTMLKYLSRVLGARKFAEIDPEEFYDFTRERPRSSINKEGRRRVQWPANRFYYIPPSGGAKGVIAFLGIEPHLRWRTFSNMIADLAQENGVQQVIHLGALLDAVPHTRQIRLTGSATNPDLQKILDWASIRSSNYQGPGGITSAVMEACSNRDIGYLSLWGHTSHYLQAAPNYRVAHTLAQTLTRLLGVSVDLSDLETAAATFDQEVVEAIDRDDQLKSYVKKLEDRYDESVGASEMPDPAEVLHDLEQFLRSERRWERGDSPGG